MASILLAAVAGSPSSQHIPGREPPCYLEDVKTRGKFSLGECKKLFLNFTTADDVQKLGFAIQKTTPRRRRAPSSASRLSTTLASATRRATLSST